MAEYSLSGSRSSEWGDAELSSYLYGLVKECEAYSEYGLEDRERALEYYHGEMRDLPPSPNRSKVVSKDLRAVFRKLVPSVMKTFAGPAGIVKYKPAGPGDEEFADQASDYINNVVIPACDGDASIYDAIYDALILRSGILKWSADRSKTVKEYPYTSQAPENAAFLQGQPGVEITDATENDDGTVDFILRRTRENNDVKLEAVPRGNFLIHPHAKTIDDSVLVGEWMMITRSDLVAMGYDQAVVDQLDVVNYHRYEEEEEAARRGNRYYFHEQSPIAEKAMEEVLVYDVYVKIDRDGDGIAETYRYLLGEGNTGDSSLIILDEEVTFERPYARLIAEREAHIFEGHSLFDDMGEVQQVKTVLLREALDNVYWQNTPQIAVDRSRVMNLDSVMNPVFGNPIWLKPGTRVSDAVQWSNIPFVADKAFLALDYMDRVAKDRTGVNELSGGVDPEVFEEMKATSAKIVSEASTAQAEQMIRTMAAGLREAFRGILRLVVMNADRPRTLRVRGNWVEYDPRLWDMDMDCSVNVGLGAGTRDKDLQALMLVKQLQTEIMTVAGKSNPFVTPAEIYNTVESIVEVLGFASPDRFFKKASAEQIQQILSQPEPPSEAQLKQQMEQQKLQADQQLATVKLRADLQVEEAQMRADLQVKQAEMAVKSTVEQQKSESQREIATLKAEVELLKHREEIALRREELGLKAIETMETLERGDLIDNRDED